MGKETETSTPSDELLAKSGATEEQINMIVDEEDAALAEEQDLIEHTTPKEDDDV